MKPTKPSPSTPNPIFFGGPEADVWWGATGIDASAWADPRPYVEYPASVSTEAAMPMLTGDPQ
jgi:hypothetical protein